MFHGVDHHTILYAMLGTRLDIAFAVTRLSRYNSNPNKKHLSYHKELFDLFWSKTPI
jgi:hypothetical protein